MAWRIAVESESAAREEVGGGSEDLGEAVAAALSLADDLGRLMGDHQVRSTIHVLSETGQSAVSIKVLPGGLVPNEAGRGSESKSPAIDP